MLSKPAVKVLGGMLLSVIFAAAFSGCVQTIGSLDGLFEKKRQPVPELGTLLQAEYAYFEKNYALAEKLYTDVKRNSKEQRFQNQALYGLACTSLVMSENIDEIKEALALLGQWQEPVAETTGYGENPRMLIVALTKQIPVLEYGSESEAVAIRKEEDIARKHQQEVEELRRTIKKLEHQISVLQAIDQEIQEKRKPI